MLEDSLNKYKRSFSGNELEFLDSEKERKQARSLRTWLKEIPKIDLHRHLTGSIRFSTVLDILRIYEIDLPKDTLRNIPLRKNPEQLRKLIRIYDSPKDLESFINRVWSILNEVVVNEAVVSRLTYEAIEDAHKENVKYMELRVSPYGMLNGNGSLKRNFTLYSFLQALKVGIDMASKDFPSTIAKIIISLPRHVLSKRFNLKTGIEAFEESVIKTCLPLKDKYIVGFDLSGKTSGYSSSYRDRVSWPPRLFKNFFQCIKENNFYITIHAGEGDSPHNIREAIELLYADRIGHGISAIEDDSVMSLLANKKIPLEICPTSNVKLRNVQSLDEHPIKKFIEKGIVTTINTDDPAVFKSSITYEYFSLMNNEILKFSRDDIIKNIKNSLSAAFLSDENRAKLKKSFLD